MESELFRESDSERILNTMPTRRFTPLRFLPADADVAEVASIQLEDGLKVLTQPMANFSTFGVYECMNLFRKDI